MLADDLHQRGRKPVDRVGLKPFGIVQGGQRKEGAVDVGAPVDEIQGFGVCLGSRHKPSLQLSAVNGQHLISVSCKQPIAGSRTLSVQGPGARTSGGFPNFWRMPLMTLNTVGWPIILASTFRLPGKSSIDTPISIVRMP